MYFLEAFTKFLVSTRLVHSVMHSHALHLCFLCIDACPNATSWDARIDWFYPCVPLHSFALHSLV